MRSLPKSNNKLTFILFTVFCFSLVLGFSFSGKIERIFDKGEYYNYVLDKKPTIYVIYDENKDNPEKFMNLVAEIDYNFREKISLRFLSTPEMYEPYKDDFRINSTPKLVIVNNRGYIIANFKSSDPVTYNRIEKILSEITPSEK